MQRECWFCQMSNRTFNPDIRLASEIPNLSLIAGIPSVFRIDYLCRNKRISRLLVLFPILWMLNNPKNESSEFIPAKQMLNSCLVSWKKSGKIKSQNKKTQTKGIPAVSPFTPSLTDLWDVSWGIVQCPDPKCCLLDYIFEESLGTWNSL